MSHVFDFRRGMATGVPWGRGNGWTIFSLSELLEVLPAEHALRGELLAFFRELCAGYLALQDEQGMWHQVLTHADAYPETSCTAMFAYAFARGVRFGWFTDAQPYARAVERAWEGLNKTSIDRAGQCPWGVPGVGVFVFAGVLQEGVVAQPQRHPWNRNRPARRCRGAMDGGIPAPTVPTLRTRKGDKR